ncbi:hypothetical protein FOZ76_11035 [Verticiella sediminum]|uniref:Uncharacterized protein n=1 Tax=Verticiella sediminum TaxID=1247510 RepID=A0A556AQ26_9BURK|nr:hypothetical protein [Verticiella sediminum]TSH95004.1 hypothetical protein FOZ76_11035 [Verticiella sediminum]
MKRMPRAAGLLAWGLALAGSAACHADSAALQALARHGLSVPADTRADALPRWRAHGAALDAVLLHVGQPPQRVLEHIARHTQTALRVFAHDGALVLAPSGEALPWLLTLRASGDGTLGVLSSLQAPAEPPTQPRNALPFWLPAGVETLLLVDEGAPSAQAVYQAPGWSSPALARHIDATLRRHGWAAQASANREVSSWRHAASGERLLIAVQAGTPTRVFVHRATGDLP